MIKGLNFTAIDFETADAPRHTICAVGSVKVIDGEIVDNAYSLVRPPENHYGKYQIRQHCITPDKTTDKPTFDVVYQQLKSFFCEYPIVAHSSSFDVDCLCKALAFYGIAPPIRHPYSCSLTLSRTVWPDLLHHDLKSMSHNLGIKLINHHNAIEDAEACALVVIKACEAKRAYTLDGLVQACGLEMGFIGEPTPACYKPMIGSNKAKIKDIVADILERIPYSQNNKLMGKRIAFTEYFPSIGRDAAEKIAEKLGAIVTNSISKKLDILVLGTPDSSKQRAGIKTSKLVKAEKLIAGGVKLIIISEDEFKSMVGID